jgi:hypothetical protein
VKGTIITLPCSGSRLAAPIDRLPTLDPLRVAVGVRDIELVPGFDTIEQGGSVMPCVAFCEEDAKLKRRPINKDATILWDAALLRAGYPGLLKPGEKRIADIMRAGRGGLRRPGVHGGAVIEPLRSRSSQTQLTRWWRSAGN